MGRRASLRLFCYKVGGGLLGQRTMTGHGQHELKREKHEDDNHPKREFLLREVLVGWFYHGFSYGMSLMRETALERMG